MIWDKWISLAEQIGLSAAQSAEMQDVFRHYYGQKHRHYHNLQHIEAILNHISAWPEAWDNRQSVELAAWFHDIIYLSHKRDNELQSARVAERQLTEWQVPQPQIQQISRIIVATAGHKADGLNQDGKAFLDLDLSILGSEAEVYDQYVAAIRKEYRRYPNLIYRPARKKILHSFLDRDRLYFTETGFERWEQPARENIKREIDKL